VAKLNRYIIKIFI
jgi:hypothetical protein